MKQPFKFLSSAAGRAADPFVPCAWSSNPSAGGGALSINEVGR